MIANSSFKAKAFKKNHTKNEMPYSADGYVTAWFMRYLKGDQEAGKAFTGTNPEILNNFCYENVHID